MEKLKNKHNHALTQWLKVIIFAILMLAPFFSVASKCLYVACNKNAKDSYSGTLESEIVNNIVHDKSSLDTSKTYYFVSLGPDTNRGNIGSSTNCIVINNVEIIENNTGYDLSNIIKISAYQNPNANNLTYYFWYNDTSTYNIRSDSNFVVKMKFNYISNNLPEYNFLTETSSVYYVTYFNNAPLDNAFEYGINQLTTTTAFAWTKNTAIYTPINAMTEGLGFTAENNVIAVLLTYWSLLTAIYVLFDIIISLFVKITHLLS